MRPLDPEQDRLSPSQPWTVSQITEHIKLLLEETFSTVWVRGELSNVRTPISGHVYATLKDENTQIRLVMFRHQQSKSADSPAFDWKEGTEVLVHGRVSVYGPQGSYQIIATRIESVGVGALQAQFERLKKRLAMLGWFDAAHKRPLPIIPRRVGLITSPKGAAIRDMLTIIHRRFPPMAVDVYPASVQGKDAPNELIRSLTLAQDLNRVDIVIIGRGGGSAEDLWCFNDETLAKTLFECAIPVVSAVGHEIDFTICDFVADVRAPTPSAAAETVVPVLEEIQQKLSEPLLLLNHLMEQRLNDNKNQLKTLFHEFSAHHPKQHLAMTRKDLEIMKNDLDTLVSQQLTAFKEQLLRLQDSCRALDPKAVLHRGYALVSFLQTGQIVTQSESLMLKDKLRLDFSDGTVDVSVENIPLV